MSGLPDERPTETLCATVPWLGQQRGEPLHPPGGPAEWPEETCYHGLQDGSQVYVCVSPPGLNVESLHPAEVKSAEVTFGRNEKFIISTTTVYENKG